MGTVRVRKATPDDADVLVDIHVRGRRSYYEGHLPESQLAEWESAVRSNGYRDIIDGPDRTWLCAELDGEVAGFALIGHPAELKQLHVRPQHWGRGVGTALNDECVRLWREAGVDVAHLDVFEHNDRARAFYARLGWQVVGEPTGGAHPHVRLELPVR
jgi:ribosomal protein S18 acetylase RimI-like enzyme